MTYRHSSPAILSFATLLFIFSFINAPALTVNSLFSDHAVLQRDSKIPVWGTARPGEEVSVALAGNAAKAKADDHGRWRATFREMKAGGPLKLTVTGTTATLEITDIMVGEVWICSGQSNMEWPLEASENSTESIAAARNNNLRLFHVPHQIADTRMTDFAEHPSWATTSPQSVPKFSAVGYFFGRDLQKKLGVPVGMIFTAWGGTCVETWMPREAFLDDPALKLRLDTFDANLAAGPSPHPPNPQDFTRLFNGMINPILPYPVRGAIWYQGETNAIDPPGYAMLFPQLIRSWRREWGQNGMSFFFVQLAPFQRAQIGEAETWPFLREAQLKTLAVPNTAMAVITDHGNQIDIHPKAKEPVGHRLALAARAITYGEDKLEYSGPMYKEMATEDGAAILTFTHAQKLEAVGGPLRGFEIAGEDKIFYPAHATIIDHPANAPAPFLSTVRVSSPMVFHPAAVRYGWRDYPDVNLFNTAGLPASPFRTDDWSSASLAGEVPPANQIIDK